MLIHNLDYLEKVDEASNLVGGSANSSDLLIELSGRNLLLKQGEAILFSSPVSPPQTITISFQNVDSPFVFSSSVTEVINGVTTTNWTLSTQSLNFPTPIVRPPRRRTGLF